MTINQLLKLPVHGWRLLCAPILPPHCRFHPSCSAYALEALDRHPWWRALGLIIRRIARCHPFQKAWYDPVPPARGEGRRAADAAVEPRMHEHKTRQAVRGLGRARG